MTYLQKHLNVLQQIFTQLQANEINWVVTGSLGFALQGVETDVGDIDIQTDEAGVYEIERLFTPYVARPVIFSATERVCSHFGALLLDGLTVEIMGDIQKRNDDGSWDDPVDISKHKRFVNVAGMRIPVLSLHYEYGAYLKLGRVEKAKMLKRWLYNQK